MCVLMALVMQKYKTLSLSVNLLTAFHGLSGRHLRILVSAVFEKIQKLSSILMSAEVLAISTPMNTENL